MAQTWPASDSLYAQRLTPNLTSDRYLENLQRVFQNQDADGDGNLTPSDVQSQIDALLAEQRASFMAQIVKEDLNGDGVITLAEVRRARQAQRNRYRLGSSLGDEARLEMEIQSDMAADTNGDGKITLQEAYGFVVQQKGSSLPMSSTSVTRSFSAFEPAQKTGGALRWDSVRATAIAFFNRVDADHSGTITSAELDRYRGIQARPAPGQTADFAALTNRLSEASPQKLLLAASCELPAASKEAKIVLVSANAGDALSNVAIGTQSEEVQAATVNIAPGSGRLYLVINSYTPIIWQFHGAVDRIERVVLSSEITERLEGGFRQAEGAPLAAETGIARERVTFLQRRECIRYFDNQPSIAAAAAVGAVTRQLGRAPDIVVAARGVLSLDLPSGAVHKSGNDNDPTITVIKRAGSLLVTGTANVVVSPGRLPEEVARAWPGGILSLDPAAVVASRRPERFTVLPRIAGLQQLVREGALEPSANYQEYLIRKKMRFPAGLYGGNSAKFLLMKGVPAPDGDPGHSCVVSEETGQPLNRMCS